MKKPKGGRRRKKKKAGGKGDSFTAGGSEKG